MTFFPPGGSLSFERSKLTLFVLFLLTIALGSGIPRLEVRNSFAGELPAEDPINQDTEQVKAFFGKRSVVLIGLEADNVYNSGTARKIKAISQRLAEVPYVLPEKVVSLVTLPKVSQ
jgi:predicted RND superfamily exporter protein